MGYQKHGIAFANFRVIRVYYLFTLFYAARRAIGFERVNDSSIHFSLVEAAAIPIAGGSPGNSNSLKDRIVIFG